MIINSHTWNSPINPFFSELPSNVFLLFETPQWVRCNKDHLESKELLAWCSKTISNRMNVLVNTARLEVSGPMLAAVAGGHARRYDLTAQGMFTCPRNAKMMFVSLSTIVIQNVLFRVKIKYPRSTWLAWMVSEGNILTHFLFIKTKCFK